MSTMDNGVTQISIHALLAESDRKRNAAVTRPKRISIHALLAESDVHHKQHITPHNVFLSTLSLRRATSALQSLAGPGRYFYPRSPCGERPPRMISSIRSISISIHALLAESDITAPTSSGKREDFYPRSPCGERPSKTIQGSLSVYFYPRSPCGERQYIISKCERGGIFLSTLSLRRATTKT